MKKECMGKRIMSIHTGDKLCQWCRKMFPKKEVRFYPKADMKMYSNCVEVWEGKKNNSKDVSLHFKNIFVETNYPMNNASITDNP